MDFSADAGQGMEGADKASFAIPFITMLQGLSPQLETVDGAKPGLFIMTKQMARELTRRHGITVFSISPNKLKGTEMSNAIDAEVVRTRGWSMEEAQKYQLAGLLSGEETDPKQVAEFVAYLLQDKDHHKYLTGCDIQYGL